MDKSKFALPERYGTGENNVWIEYGELEQEYKPDVNLGLGFPDFEAPTFITKALSEVTLDSDPGFNQYTSGLGHPRLVNVLSKLYSKLIGRDLNPKNEILVTNGGTEALYVAIMGLVDIGDEVIVIEPFFDCYEPIILMAGGIPKFIPLKPKKTDGIVTSADWILDERELDGMFNSKTKMIILNTPHNPLGKVFNLQEMSFIANLCKKHDVLCLADEVYEWMVYQPNKHIRMATLPGMFKRTITIGSAGKTFSITGWKIGWAYGPDNLMVNLCAIHLACVHSCVTPCQEAIAIGLEYELARYDSPDCYFFSLMRELEPKRDYMASVFNEIGLNTTIPEGGFFMLVDYSKLVDKVDLSNEKDELNDYRITKFMIKNVGVQAIPSSAFYSKPHKGLGENYIRFCFIKNDENLQKAAKLLKTWKSTLKL